MIGLVVSLLLAAAEPEAPAAAPPPQKAAAEPQKPQPDKVCATREQIDQRRHDDQDWKMRLRPMPAAGD